MAWLRTALAAADPAADLLLGGRCPGCDRPGWLVCGECQAMLGAPVMRIGRSLRGVPVTYAAGEYAPPLSGLVVAVKERGAWLASEPLAFELTRAVGGALADLQLGGPVALVPVPSADRAVRVRGRDAVAELARAAAAGLRRLGVDARASACLRQRRGVRDQAGLSAAERVTNMAGALELRRPPPARPLILVDDVITTGSSLAAAAAALRRHGADVRAAACVCARN